MWYSRHAQLVYMISGFCGSIHQVAKNIRNTMQACIHNTLISTAVEMDPFYCKLMWIQRKGVSHSIATSL